METIARVVVGGQIIVTDENDNPLCNFEVTRGENVATGKRLILHAMAVDSDTEYTDLTITARSITLGVVPGGDPANGHVYYFTMGGNDLVFAPNKPMRFRPTAEMDIWPQGDRGYIDNMEIGAQSPQDAKVKKLAATGKFACNGSTPSAPPDVGAAATDLASVIALANGMRSLLRSNGQAA